MRRLFRCGQGVGHGFSARFVPPVQQWTLEQSREKICVLAIPTKASQIIFCVFRPCVELDAFEEAAAGTLRSQPFTQCLQLVLVWLSVAG